MNLNLQAIEEQVNQGYIRKTKHPVLDIYIYNYTPLAQYDRHWTPETLVCRGLILDGKGEIVARPFNKFFNVEEHGTDFPDEPYEISEKMDGSLGICYYYDGGFAIATRGSFDNEQARHASRVIQERYGTIFKDFFASYAGILFTPLFEIIYPKNQVVIDYGEIDDIFLLAVIQNETGESNRAIFEGLKKIGVPCRKSYPNLTIQQMMEMEGEKNREGYVVHFTGESNLRLKFKFEEYKQLHFLFTQVTPKNIYEDLRDGKSLDHILENMPDEFHDWVRKHVANFTQSFNDVLNQVLALYEEALKLGTRKEQAEFLFKTNKSLAPCVFAKMDNYFLDPYIWKHVNYPSGGGKAFFQDKGGVE